MKRPLVPKRGQTTAKSTPGSFAPGRHDEPDASLSDGSAVTLYGPPVRAVELSFQAGSSDKFYRVFTWEDDDGGHAVVQYGRTGTAGTLKQTDYPSLEEAETFAAKQLRSKQAKGYEAVGEASFDLTDADLNAAGGVASALDGRFERSRQAPGSDGPAASSSPSADVDRATDNHTAAAAASSWTPACSQADIETHLDSLGLRRTTADADPGMIPQLAATFPDDDLDGLMSNPRWVVQPKLDGDRFVVEIKDGRILALNRQGQPKTTNVSSDVLASFSSFTEGDWRFDGEMVGRTLHVFDVAHADGFADSDAPFEHRHAVAAAIVDKLGSPHVRIVECTSGLQSDKKAALASIRDARGEGIILRDTSARYRSGFRGEGLLKHKFVSEADVYVKSVDPTKESVVLAVRDRSGRERIVGKASTIGKGDIKAGDVVEARFAHVLNPDEPVMVQPRILRKRTDKSADECSIDQFIGTDTVKDPDQP